MTKRVSVKPNTLKSLKRANRNQVGLALQRILPMTSANWLPLNNPYAKDASKLIDKDSGVPKDKRERFVRQVAASSIVHVGDAWSYLGRALDALLAGDIAIYAHLTYYAELRGAMGLLASEGIFIGNKMHIAVTDVGAVKIPDIATTHDAVWKCLSGWSRDQRANALLGLIIQPEGRSLSEWMNSSTSNAGLAWTTRLFKLVGYDISSYIRDRELRNHASYRPTRFRPHTISAADASELADSAWRLLEPNGVGGFPVLDRALLPQLLRSAHIPARTGDFLKWSQWIDSLVPAGLEKTAYVEALRAGPPTSLENPLLQDLLKPGSGTLAGVAELRPILARTLVLLRISTGSALRLLFDAGATTASVSPWLDQLALDHGLWEHGAASFPRSDMWANIVDALDDLQSAAPNSFEALHTEFARSGAILGQTQRVTAWSFS